MRQLSNKSILWTSLLVFSIFCCNKLSIEFTGGEEQYLVFAKQAIDRDWIPNSFSITEFPGTRIVFQSIVGVALQYVSIETAAFSARALNFLLLAFPFAALLLYFKFNTAQVFITTQLFVMSGQCFMGGEWIIAGFEPKSIAYVFVLWACYFLLQKRYWLMTTFIVFATLFHFLVGGWMMVVFMLYLLIKKEWLIVIKNSGFCLLLLSPFLYYLFQGYFSQPPPATAIDLDYVYCYFRLPHHLGIFRDWDFFMRDHFGGVLLTVLALCISFWFRRLLDTRYEPLLFIVQICLAIHLLFVGLASIDRYFLDASCSLFLKYYPFRTSSIAYLFFNWIGLYLLFKWIGTKSWKSKAMAAIGLLVGILFFSQAKNNIKHSRRANANVDYINATQYIKEKTEKTSEFLLINMPHGNSEYNSFIRRSHRENHTVFKFVFADKAKLLEWYERQLKLEEINQNNSELSQYLKETSIDYILSKKEINFSNLISVFNSGDYHLYKVSR